MATVIERRQWLTTLLLLTLVATALVVPDSEARAPLEVRGTAHATAAGQAPLTIGVPDTTEPGDLLIAIVAVNGPSTSTPEHGWDLVSSDSRGGQLTQALWTRRVTNEEPEVHEWSGGNRRTNQSGAIISVGGDDLDRVRLADSGTSAHKLDPLTVPSLEAERDGALLLGAFSLIGDGDLVSSGSSMTTETFRSDAITLMAAHQFVDAGTTGERVVKREISGNAVGQLLLLEQPAAPQSDDDEPQPEDTAGDGDEVQEDDLTSEEGDPAVDESDPGTEDGSAEDGTDEEEPADGTDDEELADGTDEEEPADGGEEDNEPVEEPNTPRRWLDADTWPDNAVPSSQSDVIVDGHIVIDGNASAGTVTVPPGSTLEFAPDADAQLQAFGNVVIEGTLEMQPATHDIDHALRFFGVDEEAFVGGGHEVLATDTGLWFTGSGQAKLSGTHRLPWTRAATSLAAGSTVIELEETPDGWQVGDEILISPTSAPDVPGHSTAYSEGRIRSVDGTSVTLDTPLSYDHPRVNGRWGAEVMNLTRNVHIEGTPDGRAHVLFRHTTNAQMLRNVGLRYLGPRQDTDDTYRSGGQDIPITEGVLGRYPLHFHHNGAGSAGTMVENVVVRESGHRAFVAHASDGITFNGTIAHDVFDDAYWWDRRDTSDGLGHHAVWERGSNDVVYDRAVASLVRTDPPFRGYRLSGFQLGHGSNMRVTNSVAVGVQGNKHSAGFNWPEGSVFESEEYKDEFVDFWTFDNNVAHNNRMHGVFVWQNTGDERHIVGGSVLYHNGQDGINHGAYSNRYTFADMTLYGNGHSGTRLHAQGEMLFDNITFDGAGISDYGFRTTKHRSTSGPATLRDARFSGYTTAAIAFLAAEPTSLDIIRPSFDGPESSWFYLDDRVPPESEIRVQLQDGTTFRLHPASSDRGELVPEWNARREPIQLLD